MKLGLLNAVEPRYRPLLPKTDPEAFRDMFAGIGVTNPMPTYDPTTGHLPAAIDECDAYLITGSPSSAYEEKPWIIELAQFAREAYAAGKPLVGICFGHQLIAHALGGTVRRAEVDWMLGRYEFEVFSHQPWMAPFQTDCALYFANHDQVVELPPEATLLAGSPICPNLSYVIGQQVLGIQGHPEHPLSSMTTFTEALKPTLPNAAYEHAYASFEEGQVDAALIAGWIWQFLEQAQ